MLTKCICMSGNVTGCIDDVLCQFTPLADDLLTLYRLEKRKN
jgi:hypothetical protein